MPGVNFEQVRKEITMEQVLNLIGFEQTSRTGEQLHGPCLVHGSKTAGGRTFSVNLKEGRFYCHKCRAHGHQIELWAALKNLSCHRAAIDLCRTVGIDIPWIYRW